MKKMTRFERLARGCFALTLSLAEWLELEQILATSRKARRVFRQRAQRRALLRRTTTRPYPAFVPVSLYGFPLTKTLVDSGSPAPAPAPFTG